MKYNKSIGILFFIFLSLSFSTSAQEEHSSVLIVQPIVAQSDEGADPASMALPEDLVDRAYEKAGLDFYFLEPIFFNSTKARDGLINLDEIVKIAGETGLIKGQDDIVNMFFVNAVDGDAGPLGRGMMGGNITFIALGENKDKTAEELINMQAFVIAHEVGHNLSLQHAVDDPNVPDTIPNIQGDGLFKDRINPENSLNEYQIEIIHKSPLVHDRIEFFSKENGARAILDESYEPYFSQLQIREITAFVQEKVPFVELDKAREFARQKFASAVTEFTTDEKKCISFVTEKIIDLLEENSIFLMSKHPWRFIKIEDWLCGGFAHTRGTYIILSQKHIDHLSKDWSDHMSPGEEESLIDKFGSLLVHEQMHSLQRTFKSKFDKLYTEYWNFVHANVQIETSIQVNQVSNPDAPIAEWLIPNEKDADAYFWVRTLLKEGVEVPVMGRDFIDRVFEVEKIKDTFQVKKNLEGECISTGLSEISFYQTSFPVRRGLDHPNEITAYLFSKYFSALHSNKKPFEGVAPEAVENAKLFLDWINKEMTLGTKSY